MLTEYSRTLQLRKVDGREFFEISMPAYVGKCWKGNTRVKMVFDEDENTLTVYPVREEKVR